MNFEQLLRFATEQQASDLHLQSGSAPMLRIAGQMRSIEGQLINPDALRSFLASIVPAEVASDLDGATSRGVCFARTIEGTVRLRGQLYNHLGAPGVALRLIPSKVPTPEELNLPSAFSELVMPKRGLTLIVGGSGSGRTSTLASMLALINANQRCKIVTVERPVEFVHQSDKALVTHLEVGRDVRSFRAGLRLAMAQAPDVIAVGALDHVDNLRLALQAAELGQQVLGVMFGSNVLLTLERLIALFPPNEQRLATRLLATTLEGLVAQRLATTRDGKRRPVVEILRGTPYALQTIQDNRLKDLANYIGGRQSGMQQFDQHLIELYRDGVISGTEALRLSTNPETVGAELRASRPA